MLSVSLTSVDPTCTEFGWLRATDLDCVAEVEAPTDVSVRVVLDFTEVDIRVWGVLESISRTEGPKDDPSRIPTSVRLIKPTKSIGFFSVVCNLTGDAKGKENYLILGLRTVNERQ